MEFNAKNFDMLSPAELYEILKSRTEIFLLEQNIVCQDMDDDDYKSLHCFFSDGKRVVAYLRAFPTEEKNTYMVGRVLTLTHKKGLGSKLMNKTIELLKESYNCKKICIHAQTQAIGFYEKCGFAVVSEEFLEENVPHVIMELILE